MTLSIRDHSVLLGLIAIAYILVIQTDFHAYYVAINIYINKHIYIHYVSYDRRHLAKYTYGILLRRNIAYTQADRFDCAKK